MSEENSPEEAPAADDLQTAGEAGGDEAQQNADASAAAEEAAATDEAAAEGEESTGDQPVLSEAEVGALLTGVESGEIEVQSSVGPRYAVVHDYEVPRRSRISTRSLPKLEQINAQLAERLRLRTEQLIAMDMTVDCAPAVSLSPDEIAGGGIQNLIAIEFSAAPLPFTGAIVIDAGLVNKLVELFFGGAANEVKSETPGEFSPGVRRVVDTYARVVLEAMASAWERIAVIEPELLKVETSLGLLSIADEVEPIIRSTFDFGFGTAGGTLDVLMPERMLASVMPQLKGEQRNEDPARDRVWNAAISDRLPNVSVGLTSAVGHATMTLGELICLEPGDVIPIDSPTRATLLAEDVQLLGGRYGVHGGHNAFATTHWISGALAPASKEHH